MAAHIIMDSAFQKLTTYGDIQRGISMLRILLADDDSVFLSKMERLLTQYADRQQLNIQIGTYSRDDLNNYLLKPYDIAFLDIDFGSRRGAGIDLARRLRQERADAVIIFVTNFVEYAPEGYELCAFRYLLKTDVDVKLELYFSEAVAHFSAKCEMISIQTGGELTNLSVDDILYLESEKHTVHIFMRDGKTGPYHCYASLQSFVQKLKPLGFLHIHKSYLVNMRHIKKLQCGEVLLESSTTLPVSQKNYADLKRTYLLWKGAQTWNT